MSPRIHALLLGTVRLTPHSGTQDPRPGRSPAAPLDFDLTPLLERPFPIWAWLVETPAGPLLIDTGPAAYANRAGDPRRPSSGRLRYKFALEFTVAPEQELPAALGRIGQKPKDIRRVVLTHLHPDHAGGLEHFPHADILVSRTEFEGARQAPRNFGAGRWPAWFTPRLLDYEPWPIGPFAESLALPDLPGAWLVPTPGHTAGHQSLLLRGPAYWTLLAGDAVFSQGTLLEDRLVGQADNPRIARQTLAQLRGFAREAPLLLLPAHDPDAAERLERGIVLPS